MFRRLAASIRNYSRTPARRPERFSSRADTDMYFGKTVEDGGLGKLRHRRQMVEIDKQDDGRGPVELEHEPAVIDRIE